VRRSARHLDRHPRLQRGGESSDAPAGDRPRARAFGRSFEVIYVDDRSDDRSLELLLGSTARTTGSGWSASGPVGADGGDGRGLRQRRGEIVVTLDADLQNDPADIPKVVLALEQGCDVVAGWRKDRRDGFLLRRLPSMAANRLIALVSGVSVHDTGCTLKAFRRDVVERLPIYAEQHRFLPVLSAGAARA
jgi:glycosyltransferase involved in cell wall biosynthesis